MSLVERIIGFPFDEVWAFCDTGLISEEDGHRILGQYFRYPDCCVEYFLKIYDKPDLTWVCLIDDDELGRYVQCHDCWEKDYPNAQMQRVPR